MTVVVYDGSYAGLLTAVFEVYEYKFEQVSIQRQKEVNGDLFGRTYTVLTDEQKAQRVHKKLQERLSPAANRQLHDAYLSELKDIENVMLRYMRHALKEKIAVENDYTNADVLLIKQISRKVHREKHRMEAFVRFQLTKDGLYYCIIQPDYNVLPLISKHFERRYADQRWFIYDSFRKYGLYYNLFKVEEVEMNFNADLSGKETMATINDPQEDLYQQLWQQYFSSVNIAARKNMKLHIQHMPKRYWRYLTEKKIEG